jgi:hypothetical protein
MLNVAEVGLPSPALDFNLQEVGRLGSLALRPWRGRRKMAASDAGGMAVVRKGRIRSQGSCSCGWQGALHLLSAMSVHDALLHVAIARCRPAMPLVV